MKNSQVQRRLSHSSNVNRVVHKYTRAWSVFYGYATSFMYMCWAVFLDVGPVEQP